jgi:uncharacterized protein
MKKWHLLLIMLPWATKVLAQVDFEKLRLEYEARQSSLDTMTTYPDVPYSSLKVTNKEGTTISFWWMPQKKKRGTVLLVHGFMMNKANMIARAKIYYELGYNTILMDLRARGESGGDKTTSGPDIRSDVLAVMGYYNQKLKKYGPLILAGYSHGGRAVVFAAEQLDYPVKAIILESLPYSLTESFKRTYKIRETPAMNEGNIDKSFEAISNIPVLLMIGDHDDAIVLEEARKVQQSFRNTKSRLIVFKTAGHNLTTAAHKEQYITSIKSYLQEIHRKKTHTHQEGQPPG